MCDHCSCRQHRAIAELSTEHEQILEVAWALSEQHRETGVADGPLRDRLARMLGVHVEAEETALYPLLVDTGDLDPTRRDGLEGEHTDLATALIGGTFDRNAYYELAAHIEEEEMELFPLAMFGFDDDDWAVLEATPRFLAPDTVLVR
jgi:hemerythrin-like domain-containing protein